MGTDKNIKLHIVTDIKWLINKYLSAGFHTDCMVMVCEL